MIYGNACDLYSADNDEDDCSIACRKRMRYLSTVRNYVWKRWTREYLQGLLEYQRQKAISARLPEFGEIVLIVDSSLNGRSWHLG